MDILGVEVCCILMYYASMKLARRHSVMKRWGLQMEHVSIKSAERLQVEALVHNSSSIGLHIFKQIYCRI
ncbi:putative amidohydrolase YtcJ [Fusarium oxysporum f. sp. albedinis]|nr:putative amidohydrolase YtcJ [Fusarium oxysporum f. sp. albedinis]